MARYMIGGRGGPLCPMALLRTVDAVMLRVPDLDRGASFYRDALGHSLRWRNNAVGQMALSLPDSDTELVLTTEHDSQTNWLVLSADEAAAAFQEAGGRVLVEPEDTPVGRLAVVADPFGNVLVLLDLSTGRYQVDDSGDVVDTT